MSDIKTGLMFSPLTERIYWGKMNTKTGVSVGNNQKDITSDFIGIMLQKFPINTCQNVTSNGKTECVVIVLDEENAKKYCSAKEENAQLKADKAELLGFIERLKPPFIYDEDGNTVFIGGTNERLMGTGDDEYLYYLLKKHKEQSNGN